MTREQAEALAETYQRASGRAYWAERRARPNFVECARKTRPTYHWQAHKAYEARGPPHKAMPAFTHPRAKRKSSYNPAFGDRPIMRQYIAKSLQYILAFTMTLIVIPAIIIVNLLHLYDFLRQPARMIRHWITGGA